MKRELTTTEYLKARDYYTDRRIKREVIGIVTFGFFIAVMAVFGFSWCVLKMVEAGWIN